MQNKKSKLNNGFTIVELLVVIVVIAILASIALVSYTGITLKATTAVLQSDLKNASTILEMDKVTNGTYPASKEAANNGRGLQPSPGTDLTYTYISNTDAYSLVASKGNTSYFITSENKTSTTGTLIDATLTLDLEIASNQLISDKATNGTYPVTKEAANGGNGLQPSPGVTLTYTHDVPIGGYTLIASKDGTSYSITSEDTRPVAGTVPEIPNKPRAVNIELLIVAAGGKGGYGGGGGGGGVIYKENVTIKPGVYAVHVGNQNDHYYGIDVKNSYISRYGTTDDWEDIMSIGGGDGGSNNGGSGKGANGGSGGGNASPNIDLEAGLGVLNQGYEGGLSEGTYQSQFATYVMGSGGGGGAGEPGYNGLNGNGGKGGDGILSSISGTPTYYGGGGGGQSLIQGLRQFVEGGLGGGGHGSFWNAPGLSESALPNTGGGGGGADWQAPGGSGIVIIRYLTGSMSVDGGTETFSGLYTICTFTSSGTFTVPLPPTPPPPTITVTLNGANVQAIIAPAYTCSWGTVEYGIRNRTDDGTWSAYSTWSTTTTASQTANDGVKYGYQAQARCNAGGGIYSSTSTSVESIYTDPFPTMTITFSSQELYVAWPGDGQTACKEWTAPGGKTIKGFVISQATEEDYDFFTVSVDGAEKYNKSGALTDQYVNMSATPGTVLSACMTADSSVQDGYGGEVTGVLYN